MIGWRNIGLCGALVAALTSLAACASSGQATRKISDLYANPSPLIRWISVGVGWPGGPPRHLILTTEDEKAAILEQYFGWPITLVVLDQEAFSKAVALNGTTICGRREAGDGTLWLTTSRDLGEPYPCGIPAMQSCAYVAALRPISAEAADAVAGWAAVKCLIPGEHEVGEMLKILPANPWYFYCDAIPDEPTEFFCRYREDGKVEMGVTFAVDASGWVIIDGPVPTGR